MAHGGIIKVGAAIAASLTLVGVGGVARATETPPPDFVDPVASEELPFDGETDSNTDPEDDFAPTEPEHAEPSGGESSPEGPPADAASSELNDPAEIVTFSAGELCEDPYFEEATGAEIVPGFLGVLFLAGGIFLLRTTTTRTHLKR